MVEVDCFKETFKRFKKLSVEELRDHVIDFREPEKYGHELQTQCISIEGTTVLNVSKAASLGLRPPAQWSVYQLIKVPGLLVIPNPFLPCGQHRWVKLSLVDYPIKPNVCNLDAHMNRPGNGILWPHDTDYLNPPEVVSTDITRQTSFLVGDKSSECLDTQCQASSEERPKRKKMKLSRPDFPPQPSWLSRESMLFKLRWVTLGYHYNWTSKEYTPENVSVFPEELGQLSSFVFEMAGFSKFNAEAGIVNYYHLDSTLSGHTDHSEKDLSQPLLSISFGQSAVFLIGGQTKQVPPLALLLNSGDIVIMSGESRLAYHGVPKVMSPSVDCLVPTSLSIEPLMECTCGRGTDKLPKSHVDSDTLHRAKCTCEHTETDRLPNKECLQKDSTGNESVSISTDGVTNLTFCQSCEKLAASWPTFMDYLSVSRLNINVRQVVSEKFKF